MHTLLISTIFWNRKLIFDKIVIHDPFINILNFQSQEEKIQFDLPELGRLKHQN